MKNEDRFFPSVVLRGLTCTHSRMKYCCKKPCGHLNCPDCGLFWDEGAEGGETPMYLGQREIDAGELRKFSVKKGR